MMQNGWAQPSQQQSPSMAGNVANFGMGSGAAMLGSGLAGMFLNQDNPYDAAKPFYNQIPGQLGQAFNPYMNAGRQALNTSQGQYNQLINDPGGMLNKMGQGYQQSPGYNWQLQQGMGAANNVAGAGGMVGTPQHQQQTATMAEGLANQDYYNYLSKAMGMYGMGLEGMGDINHMGYNAADQYAGGMTGNLMNQGNMAMSNQAAQNQAQTQNWGNILGGAGQLAAFAGMM